MLENEEIKAGQQLLETLQGSSGLWIHRPHYEVLCKNRASSFTGIKSLHLCNINILI